MSPKAGWLLLCLLLGGCATAILTGSGGREPVTRYPAEGDARITNEINRRLMADPSLDALVIQVQTQEGVVTLSGTVADSAAAERAGEIARGVPGVKELRNHLRIGKTRKY